MRLNRHAAWILAALLFAAAVLPLLVYFTGAATLGAYSNGGPARFLADYYADLARLRPGAWILLLGPPALTAAWRGLVALAWHRADD